MRISCSKCGASGNIDITKIPPEEIYTKNVHCKQCGEIFTINTEVDSQKFTIEPKEDISNYSDTDNFNNENTTSIQYKIVTHTEKLPSMKESVSDGAGAGFIGVIIGAFVCLIPFIGWVLGPLMILSALTMPVSSLLEGAKNSKKTPTFYTTIDGPCPYCTGDNSVRVESLDAVIGADCPICKKRFIVRGRQYFAV